VAQTYFKDGSWCVMSDEIVQPLEMTTKAGAAALVSCAVHKGLLA
jgi:hypothetical protein